MILGTWFAGWAGWHWGPWAAIVAGAVGGALGGLLLALATVTFGVDHIVAGIAINLLAPGVTRFLSSEFFVGRADGSLTQSPTMSGVDRALHVPLHRRRGPARLEHAGPTRWLDKRRWFLVSDVAGFARGFTTRLAFTTILALVMLPVSGYILWRTPLRAQAAFHRREAVGRRLARCGRVPHEVHRRHDRRGDGRLGGTWLAIDIRAYNQDQVAGRGFQGLAALIFGNWRPAGIAAGAGLFAFRAVAHPTARDGTGTGALPPWRADRRRDRRVAVCPQAAPRRPESQCSSAGSRSSTS